MLHEAQIDLRRKRAREGSFRIENLGKNRVFSDFRVVNPQTHGQYTVQIRGFELGDNSCDCPDFRSNTLGTCKHIEAVLDTLRDNKTPVRQKRAVVTRPEITLDYREQLRLRLRIPTRHSEDLAHLARSFFDGQGFWNHQSTYDALIAAIQEMPEQVTVMSDAMEFIDRELERRELARREIEWLAEFESAREASPLHQLLKVPLYDFQIRGALFLACRGRCILGDDMGLGKTIQSMAAIEILARERGIGKVLVVAPASVKYQWETEIRKFTDRSALVVEGLKDDRKLQYEAPVFYKLVNYEQVVRDLEMMNAWQPDVVVLDEAQRIKNWESKTSQAVKKLHSRYALVLTGTPLENKLEELYSIVQFVDDRRLGPAFEFLHEHRLLDEAGNLIGYRNLDKIREKLAPIFLRRTRSEVLTQLPARTDSNRYVELSEAQRLPYEEQRITLARLVQKPHLSDLDRKRILACIVNMRMICDSTFLFDKQSNISPKLEEFGEVMRDLLAEGDHQAVVFSQWETMLTKASEILDRLGIGYAVLHGGLHGNQRREVLDRFQNDPRCKVFLSTDAGGTGLNLQHADTVLNLELPWNPAVLEQRIARVHRMGQSRPVRVINFVTRNTIEERVLLALAAKQALFDGLFEGDSDEVNFAALGQPGFLAGVRDLIGEPEAPAAPVRPEMEGPKPADSPTELLRVAVLALEAFAAWNGEVPWTPDLRRRAVAALGQLLENTDG